MGLGHDGHHTSFQLAYGLEAVAPFDFTFGSPRVGSIYVASPFVTASSSMKRLSQPEKNNIVETLKPYLWRNNIVERLGTIYTFAGQLHTFGAPLPLVN